MLQHDLLSPNRNRRALPFLDIELRANYGDVYVSLPRCFRGPITIRTGDDRIALSPALEEHTALISDVPGVRVYFVGDRTRVGKWGNDGDNSDNGGAVEDSSLHGLSVSGKVFDRANQLGWRGRGASYDAQWLARVLWRC
jgi:hypothetical protein